MILVHGRVTANDVCSVSYVMGKCRISYLDPKVELVVPTVLSNGITSMQQQVISKEQLQIYMVSSCNRLPLFFYISGYIVLFVCVCKTRKKSGSDVCPPSIDWSLYIMLL